MTIILFNLIDEFGARAEPYSITLPPDKPTEKVIRSLLPVSNFAYSVKIADEPLCVTSHASNRDNKVFESQSEYGNKENWLKLEALYQKTIQNGLSTIKLQQSAKTVNGDDIIVNVTGTVAIDPQDEHTLLFTVDTELCTDQHTACC